MRTVGISILSLVLIVACDSQLIAQRVRNDICAGWYCLPVRPLKVVPPIDTDMPINVREGYHVFDSLARINMGYDIEDWAAHLSESQIFSYLRLLYQMDDFDPFLFQEFRLYADHLDSTYRTHVGFFEHVVFHEGTARLHHSPLNYLLHADNVLHVRIKSIRADSEFYSSPGKQLLFVDAEVLDAIKGRGFQRRMRDPRSTSGHPLVKFAVREATGRYSSDALDPDSYVVYFDAGGDAAGPPTYGDLHLAEGREVVVFLENMDIGHGNGVAWYEMHPLHNYEPSGGVVIVDHGMVNDPTQYWSKKKRLSVKEFKSAIRKVINGLLNQ